ncbi:methylmalonyl Co-A mutase-associated GTPase MeaB [bacterium]|nr:methylmalonyl Co-A mutase-associated GTPase MeaB [bacterium]
MVENNSLPAQEMMKKIFPRTGNSVVVGITGSPGSGKSTLVDQMIGKLRKAQKRIGIVAVDPSSPFSGGAILGDRIRMMQHSTDSQTFIRSMATRGHLGGVAKASGEAVAVLEAAGKDFIILETVGVGQDEVDVVKLADIILVVLIPGTGDDIQAFKAGITEIADLFVLNKADSPETERTERQLQSMLELGYNKENIPPIIKTVATQGQGADHLVNEINRIIREKDPQLWISRRKRLISNMLKDIISEKIFKEVTANIPDAEMDKFVERIYRKEVDPYSMAEEIVEKLKGK